MRNSKVQIILRNPEIQTHGQSIAFHRHETKTKIMAYKNPIEAMCIFPGLFTSFLEKNERLELATLNSNFSTAFGANLDEETYGVLMEIKENNWFIKIHLEGRRLTHLYMRKQTSSAAPHLETDNTANAIPESICLLKTLKVLIIRQVYFAEPISGGIPENIGELTDLEVFDARNVGFTSRFPESMVKMTKLRTLDLSGNKMIEDIPATWFGETGPLRAEDSYVNIWRRSRKGYLYCYRGSILNMPENERKTTYELVDTNENIWASPPLLCRSMAVRPVKTWYGVEYI